MSRVRQLAGGGRAVEVEPERLAGWFARFDAGHGGVSHTIWMPQRVEIHAKDAARAIVDIPFEAIKGPTGEHHGLMIDPLIAHLARPRRLGLVLVRLGGYSVGVAEDGRVVASSSDRRPVHGRHKAGGWSQQRFARRREGQARQALQAAADAVARVLLPEVDRLDAVVLGGDRAAITELHADKRLAPVFDRAEPRVLDVPEPRRTVLDEAAHRARCVEIAVYDP